jgi:hypothetical protein
MFCIVRDLRQICIFVKVTFLKSIIYTVIDLCLSLTHFVEQSLLRSW